MRLEALEPLFAFVSVWDGCALSSLSSKSSWFPIAFCGHC
jgi:hypothetical protein